jgi:hypothetical protein
MRRRQFIMLLGGAAATWPLPLRAQQPAKLPRIGIIDDAPMWNAFRQGLRDLGYLEGQNIAFDSRYADGVPARLAEAAAELVRRPVDVITTYGTPPTRAAKQATTTIPIVMIACDPAETMVERLIVLPDPRTLLEGRRIADLATKSSNAGHLRLQGIRGGWRSDVIRHYADRSLPARRGAYTRFSVAPSQPTFRWSSLQSSSPSLT